MNFLQQFEQLRLSVPRLALINIEGKNSAVCNYVFQNNDCYLCVGSDYLKKCVNMYWCYHCTDSMECAYCYYCENCYECIDCNNCYDSNYLQDCKNLSDCSFCFDCSDLQNCFACIGLYRKQYYIFNKPYSREKYEKTVAKLKRKSYEELYDLFKDVKGFRPHIFMRQLNAKNCTGDYILNSDNCLVSFDVKNSKNCMYVNNSINTNDSCDIAFAGEPPVFDCYEIMSGMGLRNCNFCGTCWHGENLEYCDICFNCRDCFGCVGLKNKQYNILNKQYSKEDYKMLADTIRQEMKAAGLYGKWFASTYPAPDRITGVHDNSRIHSSVRERISFQPLIRDAHTIS